MCIDIQTQADDNHKKCVGNPYFLVMSYIM